MAYIDDITSQVQIEDTNFSGNYGSTNIVTMKKYGWEESFKELQNDQSSGTVTDTNISNGAITSGTNADWGLDIFPTNIRAALLNGNALFPYRCHTNFKKLYILVVDGKIYKINTTTDTLFNVAKNASKCYGASNYFTQNSSTYTGNQAANRIAAGAAIVNNQSTQ